MYSRVIMKKSIFFFALLFLAISSYQLHAESDTLWTTAIGSTVRTVKFSPDGDYVYAAAEGRGPLKLDAKTGDIIMEYEGILINKSLGGVDISDDGKYLYGGDVGNTIYIWDVNQINPIDSIILNYSLESSPYIKFCNVSEKHLLCNIVYKIQNTFYARMFVFDRKTNKELTNFNVSNVSSTIISPNEKLFVYGVTNSNKEEKGFIYIYDLEKLTLIHTFDQHTGSITDLSFSPDGSRLASSDFDTYLVKIWDIEIKELLLSFKPFKSSVMAVHLFDNNKIAIGGSSIFDWRLQSSNLFPLNEINSFNIYVSDFDFLKNEKVVITNSLDITLLKADRLTSVSSDFTKDLLYPNPATNLLTVPKTFFVDSFVAMSITDLTGKVVYTFDNNQQNEDLIIDISAYNTGSYYLNFNYKSRSQSSRFIKE